VDALTFCSLGLGETSLGLALALALALTGLVCRPFLALRLIIYAPGSLNGCMQSYHSVTWVSPSLLLVWTTADDYSSAMYGRIIQSSGPLRYGMNVRDTRVHNYPPGWNGTQDDAEKRGQLIRYLEDALALADEIQDGHTGYLTSAHSKI
jgi:hypothetical protein